MGDALLSLIALQEESDAQISDKFLAKLI